MSYTLLNCLYVMTAGSYLHLDNDTVRIEIEHETQLRVPLHHLGAVVCVGDILISPALIGRCAADGIGMTLLDRNGRFRARVEGPVSGNVLLRQAQFEAARDARRRSISRAVSSQESCATAGPSCSAVRARRNQTTIAAYSKRPYANSRHRCAPPPRSMIWMHCAAWRGRPRVPISKPSIALSAPTCAGFRNGRRSRRPPRDRFNALLSFLYTLLTHDCRSALETVGLDPQVGFLHAFRPGRPALALDLVEEFRAPIADRLALTLINRGQLKADEFRMSEGGAVLMADDARRTVSIAWQEKKQET